MQLETKKTQRSKNFSKIDRVIKQTAKNYNLENSLYKYKALKYWHEIASGFVDGAGEFTKAVDFKKGVIVVACLSREVAYKIKLLAQSIVKAFNEFLGRVVIYGIFIEV